MTKEEITNTHSLRNPQLSRVVQKTTVAVVGLGYVGLPLALLLEQKGYSVIGIDIDEKKMLNLKQRRDISYLSREENQKFKTSHMRIDMDSSLLAEAQAIVVCVPTPVRDNYEPDLGPLAEACFEIGTHMSPGTLIVIESTVNPGACDELIIPMIEQSSGLILAEDFFLAHCPERINPGDTNWDVYTIPRVMGANDEESLRKASDLYNSILQNPVTKLASLKEAEAVKIVENSFRDINIAFVNELAISFDRMGIDVTKVIQAAATKPFAFMPHFPSCGVGGHCIPVDPYYLISYAAKNGFSHKFLALAREINNGMPAYTVGELEKLLEAHGKELNGSQVALLGLAYKRNVSDLRESPALEIKELLVSKGAHVKTYDPYVLEESTVENISDALTGADAVIVATDHDVFKALTPEGFKEHDVHIVVDGKNCLDKEAFVAADMSYKGIGR